MIKNFSKTKVLAETADVALSPLSKALGLMFQPKPKALIFAFLKKRHVPLHMLFVFFPIDVLYLNEHKKVIEMKENFMPFTFYSPKKKAMYVIELPAGTVAKSSTKVGDMLVF